MISIFRFCSSRYHSAEDW